MAMSVGGGGGTLGGVATCTWVVLFRVVVICSGLNTQHDHHQQHPHHQQEEHTRGAAIKAVSPQLHKLLPSGCTLCHTSAHVLAANGTAGCRCKQYKYLSEWNTVKQFYNIDKCNGFTKVPNFTMLCTLDILELSLSDMSIVDIPAHAFHGLSLVEAEHYMSSVRLSNASLNRIDADAFEGILGVVHVLDLSYNRLGTVPDGVFRLQYLQELILSNNSITLETLQPTLDLAAINASMRLQDIKIIDLSHNHLTRMPDLASLLDVTAELQELRLHGNPIEQDLSVFIPLLVHHQNLQKLTWPLRTLTCSCEGMMMLAKSQAYSAYSFPVIYPVEHLPTGSVEWHAVTCDYLSYRTFVNQPVGIISSVEIDENCSALLKDSYISGVKAGVTQTAAGYSVIRPITTGSATHHWHNGCIQLLAVVEISAILLLMGIA